MTHLFYTYLVFIMICQSSFLSFKKYLYSSKTTRIRCWGSKRKGIGKPKGYAGMNPTYKLDNHMLSGLPDVSKPYLVLGIESSCDDTGVAIVRSDGMILSNIVYSQYEIHERFGGIVPGLAMEAHKVNIEKAMEEALRQAGLKSVNEIDGIAVTKGPGLEICLRVGIQKAKNLANEYNKPFVYVHHLEAHCLISRLAGEVISTRSSYNISSNESNSINNSRSINSSSHNFVSKVSYPFLAFLASGGHTSLLICKGMGDYEVLGGTRDDALGEAFDKAARILGIKTNTSGGAAIEQYAIKGNPKKYPITVPMKGVRSCDFSYAGLKTSFRLMVEKARQEYGLDTMTTNAPINTMEEVSVTVSLPEDITADLCASFQVAAIDHVLDKVKVALDYVKRNEIHLHGFAVVGGVAANKKLRSELETLLNHRFQNKQDSHMLPLIFPPVSLCTDNGVMSAWAGIEKFSMGISDNIDSTEPISRWPLGNLVENGDFSKILSNYKSTSNLTIE